MAISIQLRALIQQEANHRCGYCLLQQQYYPAPLEIEHIIPISRGGTDQQSNLWLACRMCNLYKSDKIDAVDPVKGEKVLLFNPRQQNWHTHFRWIENGTHIEGVTSTGRASVVALQLNNPINIMVRQNWVSVGWHPPS